MTMENLLPVRVSNIVHVLKFKPVPVHMGRAWKLNMLAHVYSKQTHLCGVYLNRCMYWVFVAYCQVIR